MIYNKGDILIYTPDGDHALVQRCDEYGMRLWWYREEGYWDYPLDACPPTEYMQIYSNIFGVEE